MVGGRAWVRVEGHDNVRLRCLKVKLTTFMADHGGYNMHTSVLAIL